MLDKTLIRKVKSGDRKAFDIFCADLYPGLISYARIFLSEEWAEDVVQDVLYQIWQKRDQLDENSSAEYYTFRSVRNRALNYLKSQQHSQDFREWNYNRILQLTYSDVDIEKNSPLGKLYNGELKETLDHAVSQLTPRQREIFQLSYEQDLTSKEIGERLGLSARTVENHLYDAVKILRKSLSSEDFAKQFCILFVVSFFLH